MTRESELRELRAALRVVLRGLWRRRRPHLDVPGTRLGPRTSAILAFVAAEGPSTVGEIAAGVGLSLPAASKLTTELEQAGMVRRREDPDDRRRTIAELDPAAAERVRAWLEERNRPLRSALDALTADERAGFLKGLNALAEALMRESAHGSVRPHDRPPHRRRPHRHRPL